MSKTRRRIKREAEERKRIRRRDKRNLKREEEPGRYRSEEWRRNWDRDRRREFSAAVAVLCTAAIAVIGMTYGLVRLVQHLMKCG